MNERVKKLIEEEIAVLEKRSFHEFKLYKLYLRNARDKKDHYQETLTQIEELKRDLLKYEKFK